LHDPALDIVARGTRTSAVLAIGTCSAESWAVRVARDIVMYEGLGCLTPQTLVIEGDNDATANWLDALANALQHYQEIWPRRPQDVHLERSRRSFLERVELDRLVERGSLSRTARDEAWSIRHAREGDSAMTLGPGLRCITVVGTSDRAETLATLTGASTPLAAVGLTLDAGSEQFAALERTLYEYTGATLVCEAGSMQKPPLRWRQDGRRRLGDMLAWREDRR
jgi:hypothetical protein